MKCCINCFQDRLLQKTITEFGTIGDCDFCSSKELPVYDISNQNDLSDKIIDLIQIYEASFHEDAKPLGESREKIAQFLIPIILKLLLI